MQPLDVPTMARVIAHEPRGLDASTLGILVVLVILLAPVLGTLVERVADRLDAIDRRRGERRGR